MKSRDESLEIIERALAAAAGDEADAVLCSVDRNISRFANSNLHQNMSEISAELTLRVVADSRIGVASTTGFEPEEIRRIAKLALDAARRGKPLPHFRGLVREAGSLADLPTFDEETASLPILRKAESLRAVFDEGARRDVHFAGSWSTASASITTGNSHGLRRHAPLTFADAVVIAGAGNGSGFATRIDRRASRVDLFTLAAEATEKATMLPGQTAVEIEPGAYDVILEPAALAEIFEWMNMITFSGQSYEDGSSFFVDHLGQRVVGENVSLADNPLDEDFMPFPFDMEGVAKRQVLLIEEGVARTPVVDKVMSDRLGLPLTGHAAALGSEDHGTALHLSLAGGETTREELIAGTERGIWVTRFHYLNGLLEPKTALMTGMTRDGTFLIENGRVTRRLVNLRWTQPMIEAFSNITGLSRERRGIGSWWNPIGGAIAPTVRIRDWKITGVQKS
ncbi:MAG TPA: TldD/PmbA family protein [Thermoanaerobaculia bacterium]|nr:TldD/PmbA family protein [Thermoanaerobaculia bacterium]